MTEHPSSGGTIEIVANGSPTTLIRGATIESFLESRNLDPASCVAELNGTALSRGDFAATLLDDGDVLEVVRAVAGGCAEPAAARTGALARARLYFVCPATISGRSAVDVATNALASGADIIQLRGRDVTDAELLKTAHEFRHITLEHDALFIVNDRVDIAMIAGADGVHIGQDDLPPNEVRALLGDGAIIGLSTHSTDEILEAQSEPVDYLGVGPVFETPTKPGRAAVGLQLVETAAKYSRLPFFAIGGIDDANVAEVRSAGATGIAVVRAIANAEDPGSATAAIKASLAAPT